MIKKNTQLKKIITGFIFVLFFIIIFISNLKTSNALPCDNFNETQCIQEYNKGYHQAPECNSLFYCYPKYENDSFSKCLTITRTNFSSCKNSLSVCYNNIAVNVNEFRKCFCGEGIEFKKLNACGFSENWSGQCIDPKTCIEYTRTFLGKTIKYYTCKILNKTKKLDCSTLDHTEKRCKDENTLLILHYSYISNECGTKCIIKNIDKTEKKCSCKNNKCLNSFSTKIATFSYEKNNTNNKISNMPHPAKNTTSTKKIQNTLNTVTNNTITNKKPVFKEPPTKLKIKKSSLQMMSVILGFLVLFLAGWIFLIKTN